MALNKEIDICEKISAEVRNTFLQIYNALKNRETQLLRQIQVLSQHYKLNESYDKCFKQVAIIFDNEGDMLSSIANFGRIDFNGLSSDSDFYKIEEYQRPESDHVSLYKYIESNCTEHLNKSGNAPSETDKSCDGEQHSSPEAEPEEQGPDAYTTPNTAPPDSDRECICDETPPVSPVRSPRQDMCERVRELSFKQDDQVQQWMKQIQSEPEVEPAPSHSMEHSNISPPHPHPV